MALKKPEDFKGSSLNVYTYDDAQQRIKDQMNQNSAAWWEADDVGKKTLEQANKSLAAQLGGNVGYNPQTGTWAGVSNMPTSMKTGVDMAKPTFDVNSYLASNPAPTFDINAYLGSNPKPTWESQYSGRIDAMLNQIMNREDFSYDLESDPLWSTYKTQYNREGTRAMNDTLAAAAAGAGGMNSYAIGAAQQANNYHNAQLMDRIPELYQLAYSMYMDDLNAQRVDLSTLMNMDDVDYGRYRDNVGDWYTDLNFNYGAYRDNRADWENDRNFAYTDYRDKMGDYQWGTGFNYEAEQNQLDRDFEQMKWDYNVAQDEYEKGLRQKEIDTSNPTGGYDYTGGNDKPKDTDDGYDASDTPRRTGGGYDNGSLTDREVKLLQDRLGVTMDGKYGNDSKAAAKELTGKEMSAEEAYEFFVVGAGKFSNSVLALGIGPAPSRQLIEEIAMYGGVVESPDGTVKWANGWNKDNYQEKLAQARKLMPGFGVPH